ncbi:MAG: hypothetical protein H7Y88_05205 [Phycisphaerales bacterium]|nr:hypothetical protein [Phycisphaerales bacterium]
MRDGAWPATCPECSLTFEGVESMLVPARLRGRRVMARSFAAPLVVLILMLAVRVGLAGQRRVEWTSLLFAAWVLAFVAMLALLSDEFQSVRSRYPRWYWAIYRRCWCTMMTVAAGWMVAVLAWYAWWVF